jgi:Ca2+-binding RTX toxin-like protein
MSFVTPPSSTIWEQSGQTPENVATWNGEATQVDGSTPVQVGGIATTWTTANAPAGTPNQVVLSGQGNILNVGTGEAGIQSVGEGSVIEAVQVLGDGTKIISTGSFGAGLETANTPTTFVNTSVQVSGDVIGQPATSISTVAGGLIPTGGFYSYASGGTGDDQLSGSAFSDFFRGGLGNDTINTYGGNDLVRGGAGSDQITLGTGNDTLYYTFDQLQNGDIDAVTDFNAAAGDVDILAVQADRVGGSGNFSNFSGFGDNILSITDSVDGSVTTVQAQAGYIWKQADIFFVV